MDVRTAEWRVWRELGLEPVEQRRELAETIPDADLHVMADVSHALWLDGSETGVEAGRSFLGRSPG